MGAVWKAGDRIFVRLSEDERDFLSQLPALLDGVGARGDDPAAERMHPNAYPDDSPEAWEFTRLTDTDLDEARRSDAAAFAESLERAAVEGLSLGEAESWLRLVGDARLVLASREGIDRDGELPEPSAANPRLALVHYLGALQNEIVEVLMTTMADS